MKRLFITSLSALFLLGFSNAVFAADISMGEAEYKNSCASCHGVKAKGDGPFAEYLKAGTPSLTTLSKNNGGVFPFEHVYKIIDGRGDVKSHGPREMPVWGKAYVDATVEKRGPFFGEWYGQDIVNARILSLIDYLHGMQEK